MQKRRSSLPDNLIGWTTAAALIAFGVLFLDDAAIMGRTILALGLVSATDQVLKSRQIDSPAAARYRNARLTLSIVYLVLIVMGFSFYTWTVTEA